MNKNLKRIFSFFLAFLIAISTSNTGYVFAEEGNEEYQVALSNVDMATYSYDENRVVSNDVSGITLSYREGETVNLSILPSEGYKLEHIKVTNAEDQEIMDCLANTCTFTMPLGNVSVRPSLKAIELEGSINEIQKEKADETEVIEETQAVEAKDLLEDDVEVEDVIGFPPDGEDIIIPIISSSGSSRSNRSVSGSGYISVAGTSNLYADAGWDNGAQWGTRTFNYTNGLGNTYIAYCLESDKPFPSDGEYAWQQVVNNDGLAKALYYGYGGPEQSTYVDTLSLSNSAKYILTHVVAAYFYGNASWDYGLNSIGRGIALNFISWLNNADYVASAKIYLSNTSLTAINKGTYQETNQITVDGDSRNAITINLQTGVTLHNVTKGGTYTGRVTVYGGDTFFLTAPLNLAATQDTTWSSGELFGTIEYSYAPIAFVTGFGNQDIGSLVADPGNSVNFSVKWLDLGNIKIIKTSEDSIVSGLKFKVVGNGVDTTVTTGSDGSITIDNLIPSTYTISEVESPVRYVSLESKTVTVEAGKTSTVSFNNILKKFRVAVTKADAETGTSQGDGNLFGAVYGIYNNGKLIDEYTTDANGKFTTDYYACGTGWTLKEITPSEGYLLDETEHSLGAEPGSFTIEKNTISSGVNEQVIKGNLAIIKHTDDGSTQIETPEEGAVFEVYLKSSGSYDAAKPTERDTLVCDEHGYAKSIDLPYGSYIVRQTSGWAGRELMPDFEVTVDEDGKTYRYLINNQNFKSFIKIVKKDAETGEIVARADAGFRIYDPDGNLVTMTTTYPFVTEISTFYTNSAGYLITPEALPHGEGYQLVEVSAPEGYVLDGTPVIFDVVRESSSVEDGFTVIEVTKTNAPQKGTISVKKTDADTGNQAGAGFTFEIYASEDIVTGDGTVRHEEGELVDAITTDETGMALSKELYLGKYYLVETVSGEHYALDGTEHEVELVYDSEAVVVSVERTITNQKTSLEILKVDSTDEEKALKGVIFHMYSSADIDGEKARLIAEAVAGMANTQATEKEVLLSGQKTALTEKTNQNEASLAVFKSEQETVLADFKRMQAEAYNEFVDVGGYTDQEQDMFVAGQEESLSAFMDEQAIELDEYLQSLEEGLAAFAAEQGAALTAMDEEQATAREKLQEELEETLEITNLEKLGNRYMTDKNGKIDVTDLTHNTTYYIYECETIPGYNLSGEAYEFTVDEDGLINGSSLYAIKISNMANIVEISKKDITDEAELPGATLTIKDKEGNAIDTWVSTNEPHVITALPAGEYTLIEEIAPEGYSIADDIKFIVTDSLEIQKVVMHDDLIKVEVLKQDSLTHENLEDAKLVIYDENGKKVDSWTTKQEAHAMNLKAGSYTIKEAGAPEGYATAGDIEITVTSELGVQQFVMYDTPLQVEISKKDITNDEELPGATLQLLDSDGKVVEEWVSAKDARRIERLPVGKYTLKETAAPDGFEIAKDIEFEVTDTSTLQKVVMYDTPIDGTTSLSGSKAVKTGDDDIRSQWILAAFIGLAGSLISIDRVLRKKGITIKGIIFSLFKKNRA